MRVRYISVSKSDPSLGYFVVVLVLFFIFLFFEFYGNARKKKKVAGKKKEREPIRFWRSEKSLKLSRKPKFWRFPERSSPFSLVTFVYFSLVWSVMNSVRAFAFGNN